MVYNDNEKQPTPITGVLGTTFGGAALAAVTGLLGGNGGLGGLFGGGNPAASPVYQLSQKDTEIAQLKAERYSDELNKGMLLEISNLKQRLAAIEVAEPLREQNLQMQIGGINATIARLTQPMIPNANVAYPAPIPMFAIPAPTQGGTVSTPTTTAQAA